MYAVSFGTGWESGGGCTFRISNCASRSTISDDSGSLDLEHAVQNRYKSSRRDGGTLTLNPSASSPFSAARTSSPSSRLFGHPVHDGAL